MSPGQRKAEKPILEATEGGRTADQSTRVNILTTSLTGEVAEPSTKVNT